MFYPETLLAKKGPLARVWLAAHCGNRITDKLSKSAINSTDIETAAAEIRDENLAPMALRLSGQLLLGVVTIYSKKAEYLLGDCSNILTKVKFTFRAGNVDMSTANVRSSHAQAQNLLLRDTITEFDLSLPALDFDFDLDAPLSTANVARRQDITMDSLEFPRGGDLSILAEEEEEDPLAGGVGDLELDIGLDDISVELGRRAGSEILEDVGQSYQDMDTTFDKVPQDLEADISAAPEFILEDVPEFQPDDLALPMTPRLGSEVPDLGLTSNPLVDNETTPKPAKQAPRKRKIIEDTATEIPSKTVSANLRDTSAIRKEQTFLSSDVNMLHLQHLSLTGGFAKEVFAPGSLNPAIRNMLGPESLRRMAALRLKRKRDATERDATEERDLDEQNTPKERRIGDDSLSEIQMDPLSEIDMPPMDFIMDETSFSPAVGIESFGGLPPIEEAEVPYATLEPPQSDSIEAPQTQLDTQTQVASIDTKEAVQQIRDTLGASRSSAVSFESLSAGTTKAAASELFFQVLLLASKDAIKVNQAASYGAIDIKSRPSLSTMNFDSSTQLTV